MLLRTFKRPHPLSSSEESDEDMFPMSREVLMELCRDRDPESLPLPVRAALAGAKSMGPSRKHHEKMATEDPATRITVPVAAPQFQIRVQAQNQQSQSPRQPPTQVSCVAGQKKIDNVTLLTSPQFTPHRISQGAHLEATSPRDQSKQKHVEAHSTHRDQSQRQRGSGRNPRAWPQQAAGQTSAQNRPTTQGSVGRPGTEDRTPPHVSGDRQKDKAAINLGPCASFVSRENDKPHQSATPTQLARTGVSRSEKTLHEYRQGIRLKRKTTWAFKAGRADDSGPSKRTTRKNKQANNINVSLDPEGFYKVQVDYAHCSMLANQAGLSNEAVIQTIEEDNRERQTQMLNQVISVPQTPLSQIQDDHMEERVHLSASKDDLDSLEGDA